MVIGLILATLLLATQLIRIICPEHYDPDMFWGFYLLVLFVVLCGFVSKTGPYNLFLISKKNGFGIEKVVPLVWGTLAGSFFTVFLGFSGTDIFPLWFNFLLGGAGVIGFSTALVLIGKEWNKAFPHLRGGGPEIGNRSIDD